MPDHPRLPPDFLRIVIVGGGPSGLLTALALLQKADTGGFPWHIDVVSKGRRPDADGGDEADAGPPVILTPRGQVALASLGLIPAIDEAGVKLTRVHEYRPLASRLAEPGARVRGGRARALAERAATLAEEWIADGPAHAFLSGSVAVGRRAFCAAVLRRAEEIAASGASRGGKHHQLPGGGGGRGMPHSRQSAASLATTVTSASTGTTTAGGARQRHFPSFRLLFEHNVVNVDLDSRQVMSVGVGEASHGAPQAAPPPAAAIGAAPPASGGGGTLPSDELPSSPAGSEEEEEEEAAGAREAGGGRGGPAFDLQPTTPPREGQRAGGPPPWHRPQQQPAPQQPAAVDSSLLGSSPAPRKPRYLPPGFRGTLSAPGTPAGGGMASHEQRAGVGAFGGDSLPAAISGGGAVAGAGERGPPGPSEGEWRSPFEPGGAEVGPVRLRHGRAQGGAQRAQRRGPALARAPQLVPAAAAAAQGGRPAPAAVRASYHERSRRSAGAAGAQQPPQLQAGGPGEEEEAAVGAPQLPQPPQALHSAPPDPLLADRSRRLLGVPAAPAEQHHGGGEPLRQVSEDPPRPEADPPALPPLPPQPQQQAAPAAAAARPVRIVSLGFDLLVGADGPASLARTALLARPGFSFKQETIGTEAVRVPIRRVPRSAGLCPSAVHVFSRSGGEGGWTGEAAAAAEEEEEEEEEEERVGRGAAAAGGGEGGAGAAAAETAPGDSSASPDEELTHVAAADATAAPKAEEPQQQGGAGSQPPSAERAPSPPPVGSADDAAAVGVHAGPLGGPGSGGTGEEADSWDIGEPPSPQEVAAWLQAEGKGVSGGRQSPRRSRGHHGQHGHHHHGHHHSHSSGRGGHAQQGWTDAAAGSGGSEAERASAAAAAAAGAAAAQAGQTAEEEGYAEDDEGDLTLSADNLSADELGFAGLSGAGSPAAEKAAAEPEARGWLRMLGGLAQEGAAPLVSLAGWLLAPPFLRGPALRSGGAVFSGARRVLRALRASADVVAVLIPVSAPFSPGPLDGVEEGEREAAQSFSAVLTLSWPAGQRPPDLVATLRRAAEGAAAAAGGAAAPEEAQAAAVRGWLRSWAPELAAAAEDGACAALARELSLQAARPAPARPGGVAVHCNIYHDPSPSGAAVALVGSAAHAAAPLPLPLGAGASAEDARALAEALGEAALEAAADGSAPCDAKGAARAYSRARVPEGHSLVELASTAPALWPGSPAWLRAADAAASAASDAAARALPGAFAPSLYRELAQSADLPVSLAHADHRLWTALLFLCNGYRDGAIF